MEQIIERLKRDFSIITGIYDRIRHNNGKYDGVSIITCYCDKQYNPAMLLFALRHGPTGSYKWEHLQEIELRRDGYYPAVQQVRSLIGDFSDGVVHGSIKYAQNSGSGKLILHSL